MRRKGSKYINKPCPYIHRLLKVNVNLMDCRHIAAIKLKFKKLYYTATNSSHNIIPSRFEHTDPIILATF